MDVIFHEKQEGSLCAQHCLNALLQGPFFTPVDLADIAQQLDETERETMAEGGVQTEEYRHFMQQPSSNMDDSGFFSIQVISKALGVWSLQLIPYKSSDPVAIAARENPTVTQAFICNFKEHWLCIRKLGHQWFNLNSLLTGPELLSDTFLSMFLVQLQQEGYSIFIVVGTLPDCEADQLLKLTPAYQPIKPKLISDSNEARSSSTSDQGAGQFKIGESDLQKALEESRVLLQKDEDDDLQKALKMSMEGLQDDNTANKNSQSETHRTDEELRQRRLNYFTQNPQLSNIPTRDEPSEDELLQQALKMSMETT